MALKSSGIISLSEVNTELSIAAATAINLNQSNVRSLAGKASGLTTMNDLYGKSNTPKSIVGFTSGGTDARITSFTIPYPAGILAGDMIIICGFVHAAYATGISVPGFTTQINGSKPASMFGHLIYKMAVGGETGNLTVSITGGADRGQALMFVIRAPGTLSVSDYNSNTQWPQPMASGTSQILLVFAGTDNGQNIATTYGNGLTFNTSKNQTYRHSYAWSAVGGYPQQTNSWPISNYFGYVVAKV